MGFDTDMLTTEGQNPLTMNFSEMSALEAVTVMNREDENVIRAVREVLPLIAEGASLCADAFKKGGRVIYIGCGTAGRMGMLDAAECPPTFGVDGMVIALIAGGDDAFKRAVEGAEDDMDAAEDDLRGIALNKDDVVVGISASGRTPYVIGGLRYAAHVGCRRISIACNHNAKISFEADIPIEAVAGPECISGSTRLKAGSVQKMILNMLSTVSMTMVGRVKGNLMIHVRATNEKLKRRAKNIERQMKYDRQ